MISPNYHLTIAGKDWTSWTDVSVSRSIERMGGLFTATLVQKPGENFLSESARAGLATQFNIEGHTVLDGYIDVVRHEYNASLSEIAISGRDKTADIIDCAATVDGPFEFLGLKLENVIERILAPFGIELRVYADTGAVFKRLAIQPGETAASFIERACRYRGVLPIADGIGGLAIVKPGQQKSPGKIVYGENILKGSVSNDWSQRFSLYVLKGQAEALDETAAEELATPEARASDDMVSRYRPTLVTSENQGYSDTLQERINWHEKVARARSNFATYTVTGWFANDEHNVLWTPNTIVPVKDPARGIHRDMLITAVTFERSAQGTFTQIDLAIPQAFDIQAQRQPSDGADDDILGDF